MKFGCILTVMSIIFLISPLKNSNAQDNIYKTSLYQLKQELESYKMLSSFIQNDLNQSNVYMINSDIHYDPKIKKSKIKYMIPISKSDAERYVGHSVLDYCLENGISPNSQEALEFGALILNRIKKSDNENRVYGQKLLREIKVLEVALQERISSRMQEEINKSKIDDSSVRDESHFSCKNNDNEEGGCCCFTSSHTYMFNKRKVFEVIALFDTGKNLDCRSTVKYEVHANGKWKTIGSTQVISSRGKETYAPNKVSVPVNEVIDGFRLGDGCRCCIDFSEIWLQ